MYHHYVRQRNLSYSLEDIKQMTESCEICCEVKPQFFRPLPASLIKCSQPFERLIMDFNGPLFSATKSITL